MTAILINEPDQFPVRAVECLRQLGTVYLPSDSFDSSSIEVIFVRLGERLGAPLSRRFPRLRFIVSPTTGLNHIDQAHFAARGIEILSLRGRTEFLNSIRATAEHTLALTLAMIRRVPQAARHTRAGGWDRYAFKGTELSGKRVLLLGFGRIGRQLETLYSAFGCKVRAHDIHAEKIPLHLRCDYPAVLAETDLLSIHVNLIPETVGLVSRDLLRRLPREALIVNTSRGEIVDQIALMQMLRDGLLAGAALDVLHGEPSPFGPELTSLMADIDEDRLLVTPHIAGFTHESLEKVEVHMAYALVERMLSLDSRGT